MKKIYLFLLALCLSLFTLTPNIFAGNNNDNLKITANANDNNNRRGFYVKVVEEKEKLFKLLVKGSKIEPIEVKIYDSAKNLIAQDYIDTNKSFTKMYNLQQVKSKKIIFEIINREELIAKEEFK